MALEEKAAPRWVWLDVSEDFLVVSTSQKGADKGSGKRKPFIKAFAKKRASSENEQSLKKIG